MILTSLTRFRDWGLLFLRVALGALFIYAYGWRKLAGGVALWREVGSAVHHVGIHFGFVFWGLMAALSETLGNVLVILGFLFRPACIMLLCTMLVAATTTLSKGVAASSHPLELAIVYFSLIFIGPGKYSADKS